MPDVFRAAGREPSVERAARVLSLPFDRAFRAIEWLYLEGYLDPVSHSA